MADSGTKQENNIHDEDVEDVEEVKNEKTGDWEVDMEDFVVTDISLSFLSHSVCGKQDVRFCFCLGPART